MIESTQQLTDSASPPSIRVATSIDIPAIRRLLEVSSLPTAGIEATASSFLVANAGGQLVGVVGLESCGDKYALLRSAAVSDAWRGRGVGRKLVESTIDEAKARGLEALYLLTTTAEEYFPTFGFSKVDRDSVPSDVKATEEFHSACPASATVMTLSLR